MVASSPWRLVLLLSTTTFLILSPPAKAQGASPRLSLAEFEISADDTVIVLPVLLQGRVYDFVFDTGMPGILYDTSLRPLLGPVRRRVSVPTPHGSTMLNLFDAPEAYVGSLSLQTQKAVACADLKELRQAMGRDIHGIVGMSFLKDRVVEINFDENRVAFLLSADNVEGERVSLDMIPRANLPLVEVDVEGMGSRRFMIDTGAADWIQLSGEDFDSLVASGALEVLGTSRYLDLSGKSETRYGVVKSFTLGVFHHSDLRVERLAASRPNTLGIEYLKRYNLVFDFPKRALYLSKSKAFDRTDLFNRSGLHILRKDGRVMIEVVDEKSPAARAGIQPNDTLLKLDGIEASSASMHSLRLRLRSNDRNMMLTVQRGEKLLEVPLELHDGKEAAPSTKNDEPSN